MIVRLKRLQTCFLSTAQLLYSATGHFVIVIPACLSTGLWEGALHLYCCLGYHRYQPFQPSWGDPAWERLLANVLGR